MSVAAEIAKHHFNHGVQLQQEKKYQSALREFRETLRHNPKIVEAHHNIGLIYIELGQYVEAVEALQAGLRYRPNSAAIHSDIGRTRLYQKRYDESITAIWKAIQLEQNSKDYHNLGMAYFFNKDMDNAMDAFRQSVYLSANDALSQMYIGHIYSLRNEHDKAIDEYRKSLRFDPTLMRARNGLIMSFFNQGKYIEAIREWLLP